jgi:hypothetical protein
MAAVSGLKALTARRGYGSSCLIEFVSIFSVYPESICRESGWGFSGTNSNLSCFVTSLSNLYCSFIHSLPMIDIVISNP